MTATYHRPRFAMDTPGNDPRRTPGQPDHPFPASRWGATGRAHPLSLAQRSIWEAQQCDRSSSAYHLIFAARVRSPLATAHLEQCLQTLIDRHPALRTTFHEEEEGPVQHVHSRQDIRLTCIDARHWGEEQLAQIVRLTSRQPLDLSDSVLRVVLFTRAPEDHVLLLMAHQIAVDSWGLGLLLRELRDLHAGDRLPPAPADTPLDYVADLAARVEGPEGRDLEAFWTRYLSGAPADPSLPYDREPGSTPHRAGGSIPFELGVERTARVRQLARDAATTPYVVLLSTYQLLLGRYTGRDDIVVAAPFSGRMRRRWQNVVGNFENTVVMRARLESGASFRSLLAANHAGVGDAMRNRELPFARICELLRAERQGRLDSACRVGFAWQGLPRMDALAGFLKLEGIPAPPADFGGMALEPFPLPQQEGQLELMLELGGEVGSSLFGTLRYDSTHFEAASAERFVGHYMRLLDGLLDAPDGPVSAVSLLDEDEWAGLMEEWRRFSPAEGVAGGIHRLIEEQALRQPGRVAVVGGSASITYREMDRRANRLARVLRAGGVDPRTRVAIALDPSVDSVVAALAVLKVGAACVPFDASRGISVEAAAAARVGSVIASRRSQWSDASRAPSPRVFVLEELTEPIERTSSEPLGVAALPEDGAVVALGHEEVLCHRAAVGILCALAERLGVAGGASVASFRRASPSAALLDILLPLVAGATAVLPAEVEGDDHRQLGSPTASLEHGNPSVLIASPAIWRALLQSDWEGSSTLAALVDAGSLTPGEVDRLRSRVGSIWATLAAPGSGAVAAARKLNRGDRSASCVDPLPCVRLCVLDEQGQPSALAVPGALLVGGIAPPPPLTGEQDPCSTMDPCDGSGRLRLFATGRKARRRAGGVIEVLGG